MSKNLLWIIIAAVVIATAWWYWSQSSPPTPLSYLTEQTSNSPSPSSTVKKAGTIKGSQPGATPASNANYSQLVSEYRNAGRLLQFNDSCHTAPDKIVVKVGAKVMLDNRSALAETVTLDNQTYTLPAYSYRIVTINPAKTLPYDLGVDCKSSTGTTENSGTINVQALIGNQVR